MTSLTAHSRGPLLYLGFPGAHSLIYGLLEVVDFQEERSLQLPNDAIFPVRDHVEHTPCEAGHLSSAIHL